MPNSIPTTVETPAFKNPTKPAKAGWLARFMAWLNDPVEELCMACDGAMRETPGSGIPRCERCGGSVGHRLGSAGLRGKRAEVPKG